MKNSIDAIKKYGGTFSGVGRNHENENFLADLDLSELLGGRGLQIKFSARSKKDTDFVFHSEVSIITATVGGGISLFNLNTNTPFLTEHSLISEVSCATHREFTFRFGDVDKRDSFREEVRLDLWKDGRVGYHYSWGMPGEEFAYRSGAVMNKS